MDYICLRCVKYIRKAGVQVTYRPGDWLEVGKDVGKQAALVWVAEGSAHCPHKSMRDPVYELAEVKGKLSNMGIVVRGDDFEAAKQCIPVTERLGVVEGGLELPFNLTLLWSPPCPLRTELLPVGFLRLTRGWQLAVPLLSYEKLASNIGSPQDRELTKKIVPDLRIMIYDTRLVYVRRCPETKRLIELWRKEPGDERLAFLRALFAVKPIICALPQKWVADAR